MAPPFFLFLILPVAILAPGAEKAGTWAVGDCILAQFQMNISIHMNPKDPKVDIETVQVSPDAKVDATKSNCGGDNDDQTLVLSWTAHQSNDSSIELAREITIKFRRNTTDG